MHWLRRIGTETRIVVLVVFLALFQAILLSVFGLVAIRGERRHIRETVQADAENFLREFVVWRAQNRLRNEADAVFRRAFEPDTRGVVFPASSPFRDAFRVHEDRSILDRHGRPLYQPDDVVRSETAAARAEAAQLVKSYQQNLFEEREKARLDLDFALRRPFSVDEDGAPLGLLFAASPLVLDGAQPAAPALLSMRWIGLLNRIAGRLPAEAVRDFLGRVDAAGAGDAAYHAGREEQDRSAAVVDALRREAAFFVPSTRGALHENRAAAFERPFWVRRVGANGPIEVLSVDRVRLEAFLDEIAETARADVKERVWTDPRIERLRPGRRDGPELLLADLPGYAATATLAEDDLREQAWRRERFYWYIIGFSVAGILAGGLYTARVVMREVKLAKLKSGFVSNVSHELKTPLTSIRMFVEMLRGGQVSDAAEREECLGVIAQETERLGKLIQRVLDFGRLDAKQRRFRWTKGSLAPLLRRESERFRRATGLSDEQFTVRIAVNLPPVVFDPEAFSEVVTNLLGNAYKYTPAQNRRIEVLLGPFRGRVLLAVEDNGPGVPRHEREKIFEQFYRGGDYLNRPIEGTGLGLSIARSIVRAHGGRILVEDRPEGGSRFLVVLPAAGPAQSPAPAAPAEVGS